MLLRVGFRLSLTLIVSSEGDLVNLPSCVEAVSLKVGNLTVYSILAVYRSLSGALYLNLKVSGKQAHTLMRRK